MSVKMTGMDTYTAALKREVEKLRIEGQAEVTRKKLARALGGYEAGKLTNDDLQEQIGMGYAEGMGYWYKLELARMRRILATHRGLISKEEYEAIRDGKELPGG